MKKEKHLVDFNAEWMTINNPIDHINQVARTCYKSDRISSDSSIIRQIIENEHFAMLEHSHFSFFVRQVNDSMSVPEILINVPGVAVDRFKDGWAVTVSMSHLFNPVWDSLLLDGLRSAICNEYKLWRYEIADEPENELSYPMYITDPSSDNIVFEISRLSESDIMCEPFNIRHLFYSCKFTCDRGVSHELVRHRVSFAQESTRYCNYASDEFNRSVTFVKPSTFSSWPEECKSSFLEHITASEYIYNYMVYKGMEPQQARAVLPNSLKTEVVMTANVLQWRHFFNVRYKEFSGKPHPDMKKLAEIAYSSCPDIIKC